MKRLWELSIRRPGGVLYCRVIAISEESARKFARDNDPVWENKDVIAEDLGEVTGDDRLLAMKMFAFVKSAVCPTCGK